MSEAHVLGGQWYELFSRHAEDLYPGRYTSPFCLELAEMAIEIRRIAEEKGSRIVVHNYLRPEFHEIANLIGDSLGLAKELARTAPKRVDFAAVFFMGATAKISLGDATRVFTCDTPQALGCSLVTGTDYAWIETWKRLNPGGILVTYVNSSAYAKSISDYICTSGNADRIIAHAVRNHPGVKILVLPDKFLAQVMIGKAMRLLPEEMRTDALERLEPYTHSFGGANACCYVHEKIGDDALERALDEYPGAELMAHPECGCTAKCMLRPAGAGSRDFLSTEQMVTYARQSPCDEFVVATELGLIYRLRKEMPHKRFYPVSMEASCRYMKKNTFEALLRSLREDRIEIVFCDDGCCDPKKPYQDDRVVHISRTVAARATTAINRMLTI